MTSLAVSSTGQVLAIIGLVVGLVVFGVVVFLLQSTLTPLTKVLASVKSAKTAPMLERGVPGTEQLGQTRRLAESVPGLALAYLHKLSLGGGAPAPAAAPATPSWTPPAPSAPPAAQEDSRPELPAWQKYRG
ncbi:MAG: hypothetical protein QOE11_2040 [Solirubrobacteraceae bacterium]|jgi:hypothetical protein|nr:hypothetical protein [Solirubrobacteraceae bacterium]